MAAPYRYCLCFSTISQLYMIKSLRSDDNNVSFFRKQTCFLCEMPRSPWAVLHDFTELVCR